MLAQLRIVDFAIIEEVELTFGPGLNVLTGETGAGKSIIVGAVGLLRGGRATGEVVRSGRKEAAIEALFDVSRCVELPATLEQLGLPEDPKELLIRRILPRAGRGRIYVNGSLCTLAVLATLTRQLVEISGQHEHQLLSDRSTHRRLLDEMGGTAQLTTAVKEAYAELRQAAEALARRELDDRQRAGRIDFLRYQLQELDQAALREGEDLELEAEQLRLQRASELLEGASWGEQELYSSEGSASERLGRLERQLGALAAVDPQLDPLVHQLAEARTLVEDAAQSLSHYGSKVELDPSRLQEVEQRLDLLHRLKRKHGATVGEILAEQQQMSAELEELLGWEERLSGLERALGAARRRAEQAAQQLSRARQAAAGDLAAEVSAQLAQLHMKGARLQVVIEPQPPREGDDPALIFEGRRLGPEGWDRVELLLAPNPGEEPRPLARIASGGELSRVMLAIHRALGAHDPVWTSIYDEVDAGISGPVADVVGRNLAQIAQHRQVLCVTHLPQVAAHADQHFHVGKQVKGRRTQTTAGRLTPQERVEELARLLGGARVTAQARANAQQLLEAAGQAR